MADARVLRPPSSSRIVLTERRTWVRHPCALAGNCQPLVNTQRMQWQARIVNFSRGGMALTLRRRFENGTILMIEIQSEDGQASLCLRGRVVRVVSSKEGGWLHGLAFVTELSDEEMEQLR